MSRGEAEGPAALVSMCALPPRRRARPQPRSPPPRAPTSPEEDRVFSFPPTIRGSRVRFPPAARHAVSPDSALTRRPHQSRLRVFWMVNRSDCSVISQFDVSSLERTGVRLAFQLHNENVSDLASVLPSAKQAFADVSSRDMNEMFNQVDLTHQIVLRPFQRQRVVAVLTAPASGDGGGAEGRSPAETSAAPAVMECPIRLLSTPLRDPHAAAATHVGQSESAERTLRFHAQLCSTVIECWPKTLRFQSLVPGEEGVEEFTLSNSTDAPARIRLWAAFQGEGTCSVLDHDSQRTVVGDDLLIPPFAHKRLCCVAVPEAQGPFQGTITIETMLAASRPMEVPFLGECEAAGKDAPVAVDVLAAGGAAAGDEGEADAPVDFGALHTGQWAWRTLRLSNLMGTQQRVTAHPIDAGEGHTVSFARPGGKEVDGESGGDDGDDGDGDRGTGAVDGSGPSPPDAPGTRAAPQLLSSVMLGPHRDTVVRLCFRPAAAAPWSGGAPAAGHPPAARRPSSILKRSMARVEAWEAARRAARLRRRQFAVEVRCAAAADSTASPPRSASTEGGSPGSAQGPRDDAGPGAEASGPAAAPARSVALRCRTLRCTSRVATSMVAVRPAAVDFGECNIGVHHHRSVAVVNHGDLPTEVAVDVTSKVVSVAPATLTLQPRATAQLRISFVPRKVNNTYRRAITVRNVRNPANTVSCEVQASNMDRHNVILHSLFYKLYQPKRLRDGDTLNVGPLVGTAPSARLVDIKNVAWHPITLSFAAAADNATVRLCRWRGGEGGERGLKPVREESATSLAEMRTDTLAEALGGGAGARAAPDALAQVPQPAHQVGVAEAAELPAPKRLQRRVSAPAWQGEIVTQAGRSRPPEGARSPKRRLPSPLPLPPGPSVEQLAVETPAAAAQPRPPTIASGAVDLGPMRTQRCKRSMSAGGRALLVTPPEDNGAAASHGVGMDVESLSQGGGPLPRSNTSSLTLAEEGGANTLACAEAAVRRSPSSPSHAGRDGQVEVPAAVPKPRYGSGARPSPANSAERATTPDASSVASSLSTPATWHEGEFPLATSPHSSWRGQSRPRLSLRKGGIGGDMPSNASMPDLASLVDESSLGPAQGATHRPRSRGTAWPASVSSESASVEEHDSPEGVPEGVWQRDTATLAPHASELKQAPARLREAVDAWNRVLADICTPNTPREGASSDAGTASGARGQDSAAAGPATAWASPTARDGAPDGEGDGGEAIARRFLQVHQDLASVLGSGGLALLACSEASRDAVTLGPGATGTLLVLVFPAAPQPPGVLPARSGASDLFSGKEGDGTHVPFSTSLRVMLAPTEAVLERLRELPEEARFRCAPGEELPPRDLPVRGMVVRSWIQLLQRNVSFGRLSEGETRSQTLRVVNRSGVPTLYRVRKGRSIDSSYLHITTPTLGLVPPYGTTTVRFVLHPSLAGRFDERIAIVNLLSGNNVETLTVKAKVKWSATFRVASTQQIRLPPCTPGAQVGPGLVEVQNLTNRTREFEVAAPTDRSSFIRYRPVVAFEVLGTGERLLTPERRAELEDSVEQLEQKLKIAIRKHKAAKEAKVRSKLEAARRELEQPRSGDEPSPSGTASRRGRDAVGSTVFTVPAGETRAVAVRFGVELAPGARPYWRDGATLAAAGELQRTGVLQVWETHNRGHTEEVHYHATLKEEPPVGEEGPEAQPRAEGVAGGEVARPPPTASHVSPTPVPEGQAPGGDGLMLSTRRAAAVNPAGSDTTLSGELLIPLVFLTSRTCSGAERTALTHAGENGSRAGPPAPPAEGEPAWTQRVASPLPGREAGTSVLAARLLAPWEMAFSPTTRSPAASAVPRALQLRFAPSNAFRAVSSEGGDGWWLRPRRRRSSSGSDASADQEAPAVSPLLRVGAVSSEDAVVEVREVGETTQGEGSAATCPSSLRLASGARSTTLALRWVLERAIGAASAPWEAGGEYWGAWDASDLANRLWERGLFVTGYLCLSPRDSARFDGARVATLGVIHSDGSARDVVQRSDTWVAVPLVMPRPPARQLVLPRAVDCGSEGLGVPKQAHILVANASAASAAFSIEEEGSVPSDPQRAGPREPAVAASDHGSDRSEVVFEHLTGSVGPLSSVKVPFLFRPRAPGYRVHRVWVRRVTGDENGDSTSSDKEEKGADESIPDESHVVALSLVATRPIFVQLVDLDPEGTGARGQRQLDVGMVGVRTTEVVGKGDALRRFLGKVAAAARGGARTGEGAAARARAPSGTGLDEISLLDASAGGGEERRAEEAVRATEEEVEEAQRAATAWLDAGPPAAVRTLRIRNVRGATLRMAVLSTCPAELCVFTDPDLRQAAAGLELAPRQVVCVHVALRPRVVAERAREGRFRPFRMALRVVGRCAPATEAWSGQALTPTQARAFSMAVAVVGRATVCHARVHPRVLDLGCARADAATDTVDTTSRGAIELFNASHDAPTAFRLAVPPALAGGSFRAELLAQSGTLQPGEARSVGVSLHVGGVGFVDDEVDVLAGPSEGALVLSGRVGVRFASDPGVLEVTAAGSDKELEPRGHGLERLDLGTVTVEPDSGTGREAGEETSRNGAGAMVTDCAHVAAHFSTRTKSSPADMQRSILVHNRADAALTLVPLSDLHVAVGVVPGAAHEALDVAARPAAELLSTDHASLVRQACATCRRAGLAVVGPAIEVPAGGTVRAYLRFRTGPPSPSPRPEAVTGPGGAPFNGLVAFAAVAWNGAPTGPSGVGPVIAKALRAEGVFAAPRIRTPPTASAAAEGGTPVVGAEFGECGVVASARLTRTKVPLDNASAAPAYLLVGPLPRWVECSLAGGDDGSGPPPATLLWSGAAGEWPWDRGLWPAGVDSNDEEHQFLVIRLPPAVRESESAPAGQLCLSANSEAAVAHVPRDEAWRQLRARVEVRHLLRPGGPVAFAMACSVRAVRCLLRVLVPDGNARERDHALESYLEAESKPSPNWLGTVLDLPELEVPPPVAAHPLRCNRWLEVQNLDESPLVVRAGVEVEAPWDGLVEVEVRMRHAHALVESFTLRPQEAVQLRVVARCRPEARSRLHASGPAVERREQQPADALGATWFGRTGTALSGLPLAERFQAPEFRRRVALGALVLKSARPRPNDSHAAGGGDNGDRNGGDGGSSQLSRTLSSSTPPPLTEAPSAWGGAPVNVVTTSHAVLVTGKLRPAPAHTVLTRSLYLPASRQGGRERGGHALCVLRQQGRLVFEVQNRVQGCAVRCRTLCRPLVDPGLVSSPGAPRGLCVAVTEPSRFVLPPGGRATLKVRVVTLQAGREVMQRVLGGEDVPGDPLEALAFLHRSSAVAEVRGEGDVEGEATATEAARPEPLRFGFSPQLSSVARPDVPVGAGQLSPVGALGDMARLSGLEEGETPSPLGGKSAAWKQSRLSPGLWSDATGGLSAREASEADVEAAEGEEDGDEGRESGDKERRAGDGRDDAWVQQALPRRLGSDWGDSPAPDSPLTPTDDSGEPLSKAGSAHGAMDSPRPETQWSSGDGDHQSEGHSDGSVRGGDASRAEGDDSYSVLEMGRIDVADTGEEEREVSRWDHRRSVWSAAGGEQQLAVVVVDEDDPDTREEVAFSVIVDGYRRQHPTRRRAARAYEQRLQQLSRRHGHGPSHARAAVAVDLSPLQRLVAREGETSLPSPALKGTEGHSPARALPRATRSRPGGTGGGGDSNGAGATPSVEQLGASKSADAEEPQTAATATATTTATTTATATTAMSAQSTVGSVAAESTAPANEGGGSAAAAQGLSKDSGEATGEGSSRSAKLGVADLPVLFVQGEGKDGPFAGPAHPAGAHSVDDIAPAIGGATPVDSERVPYAVDFGTMAKSESVASRTLRLRWEARSGGGGGGTDAAAPSPASPLWYRIKIGASNVRSDWIKVARSAGVSAMGRTSEVVVTAALRASGRHEALLVLEFGSGPPLDKDSVGRRSGAIWIRVCATLLQTLAPAAGEVQSGRAELPAPAPTPTPTPVPTSAPVSGRRGTAEGEAAPLFTVRTDEERGAYAAGLVADVSGATLPALGNRTTSGTSEDSSAGAGLHPQPLSLGRLYTGHVSSHRSLQLVNKCSQALELSLTADVRRQPRLAGGDVAVDFLFSLSDKVLKAVDTLFVPAQSSTSVFLFVHPRPAADSPVIQASLSEHTGSHPPLPPPPPPPPTTTDEEAAPAQDASAAPNAEPAPSSLASASRVGRGPRQLFRNEWDGSPQAAPVALLPQVAPATSVTSRVRALTSLLRRTGQTGGAGGEEPGADAPADGAAVEAEEAEEEEEEEAPLMVRVTATSPMVRGLRGRVDVHATVSAAALSVTSEQGSPQPRLLFGLRGLDDGPPERHLRAVCEERGVVVHNLNPHRPLFVSVRNSTMLFRAAPSVIVAPGASALLPVAVREDVLRAGHEEILRVGVVEEHIVVYNRQRLDERVVVPVGITAGLFTQFFVYVGRRSAALHQNLEATVFGFLQRYRAFWRDAVVICLSLRARLGADSAGAMAEHDPVALVEAVLNRARRTGALRGYDMARVLGVALRVHSGADVASPAGGSGGQAAASAAQAVDKMDQEATAAFATRFAALTFDFVHLTDVLLLHAAKGYVGQASWDVAALFFDGVFAHAAFRAYRRRRHGGSVPRVLRQWVARFQSFLLRFVHIKHPTMEYLRHLLRQTTV